MLIAMATTISVSVAVVRSRDRRPMIAKQDGADDQRDEIDDLVGRDAGRRLAFRADRQPVEVHDVLLVPRAARSIGRSPATPSVTRPGRSAASLPIRSISRSMNSGMFAVTATSRFGGRPVSRRRSATVIPVVSSPRVSTSTNSASVVTRRPVERRGDGQRVVDERPVEAVVPGVELHVEAQRIGHVTDDRVARHGPGRVHRLLAARQRDRIVGRAARPPREADDVVGEDPRLLGDVEAERERPRDRGIRHARVGPCPEDDLRRVRVAVDVPLGRRRRVARHAERAAHQRVAAQQPGEGGLAQDRDREVRQRPERDQRDLAGTSSRLVDDDVDPVALRQRPRRRRQLGVAEALRSVRLGRRLERADQRHLAPERDLDVGPARRAPGPPGC